jgi:hypothetical protein
VDDTIQIFVCPSTSWKSSDIQKLCKNSGNIPRKNGREGRMPSDKPTLFLITRWTLVGMELDHIRP